MLTYLCKLRFFDNFRLALTKNLHRAKLPINLIMQFYSFCILAFDYFEKNYDTDKQIQIPIY